MQTENVNHIKPTSLENLTSFGVLLLPLVLVGCAAVGPEYKAPPANVPTQWHSKNPQDFSDTKPKELAMQSWWAQFEDPVLNKLIEQAQRVSPTIAVTQSRLMQARADLTGANARGLPNVSLNANSIRSGSRPIGQKNRDGNNVPDLNNPNSTFTNNQSGAQTTAQASSQLQFLTSWELDLFGGNRRAQEAAQARQQGAQAGWHDARVSIAAEAANAYLGLRYCYLQLELVRQDSISRAQTAKLTQLTTQAGFQSPANNALASASAADASSRAKQQQAQCMVELKSLVALTAIDEPELVQLLQLENPNAAALPKPKTVFVPAVPADLLNQRPDLLQALTEVEAANADIGQTQANAYPKINLTGFIAPNILRFSGENTKSTQWSIGPAISLPLFDGGSIKANVSAAQARYEQAVIQYQSNIRNAVREVETALSQLDSFAQRESDVQIATEGFAASLKAEDTKNRAGLGSLFELEEARRNALTAQISLLSLRREQVATWISLYRAVGGGFTK